MCQIRPEWMKLSEIKPVFLVDIISNYCLKWNEIDYYERKSMSGSNKRELRNVIGDGLAMHLEVMLSNWAMWRTIEGDVSLKLD